MVSAPLRRRKAYRIKIEAVDPYVIYAPTFAKARAMAISDIRKVYDIPFMEAVEMLEECRREAARDQWVPDRHPLAVQLPTNILHNVVHAFGGTGLNAGYRDYFYASERDWRMKAALYHGLFEVCRRDKGRDGAPVMIMYALSDLGFNVARGEQRLYERV